jgi:D-alanine-D-alanine ligase-like ATP-grasp enzyme
MTDYHGKRVGVLMGGWSSEREISLKSGLNVLAALRRLPCRSVRSPPRLSRRDCGGQRVTARQRERKLCY